MKQWHTVLAIVCAAFVAGVVWGLVGEYLIQLLTNQFFIIYAHLAILGGILFCLARSAYMNEFYTVKLLKLLESMDRTLDGIYQALRPDTMAETVEFYVIKNGVKKKVDNMFMKIDEVADLAVAFKDRQGNLAKVDGIPQWALTDAALGTLAVAEDGLSAVFAPVAVGLLKVQVKADADLGEGVKEIIGELEIDISALEAEKVEISGSVRVAQPANKKK